jgi:hypothetical protein
MIFFIESIDDDKAKNAYNSNCIFDEILEFYAFLNVWSVSEVEDIEEPSERFFYDHKNSIDLADELFEKCQKIIFILDNLENTIKAALKSDEDLNKCKNELVEQGILEIIFYKTTPPPFF